jgi:hypothetical protein
VQDSDPGSYQGWYLIDGLPENAAIRLWAWRGNDSGMEQYNVAGGYEPDQARWPVYGQCDDPLGLWYQVSILYGETDVTLPIAPPPECA